jgi:hypothetical protein
MQKFGPISEVALELCCPNNCREVAKFPPTKLGDKLGFSTALKVKFF